MDKAIVTMPLEQYDELRNELESLHHENEKLRMQLGWYLWPDRPKSLAIMRIPPPPAFDIPVFNDIVIVDGGRIVDRFVREDSK